MTLLCFSCGRTASPFECGRTAFPFECGRTASLRTMERRTFGQDRYYAQVKSPKTTPVPNSRQAVSPLWQCLHRKPLALLKLGILASCWGQGDAQTLRSRHNSILARLQKGKNSSE